MLDVVLEHMSVLGDKPKFEVFKNARFLNSSRSFPAARTFTMTMLPITYGYALVSKADDDSKNLETQLRLLAEHGDPERPGLFRRRQRPQPAAPRLAGADDPYPRGRHHRGGLS